jgi:peptide/nickel transport system permease protein
LRPASARRVERAEALLTESVVSPVTPGRPSATWVGSIASNIWVRFLIRRAVGLVLVLAALVVAVFLLVYFTPGDPVVNAMSIDSDPAMIEQIRHANGFDKPIYVQFARYVDHLAHGDLGRSFVTNTPVSDTIRQGAVPSFQLAASALVVVLVLGITIGLLAGALTREGRHPRLELGFTSSSSLLASIPDYLLATMLVFVFAVQLRWLPVAGTGGFKTLILPVLAVSSGPTMTLARLVRLETLNVLAQDYIRTGRSQRLPARLIYLRHALPNVVTAALTIGGIIFAHLVGGAVIVENIFARAGLGSALVHAVTAKQAVVVQGITLVVGITVVAINTLVDLTLAILDPRSLTKGS